MPRSSGAERPQAAAVRTPSQPQPVVFQPNSVFQSFVPVRQQTPGTPGTPGTPQIFQQNSVQTVFRPSQPQQSPAPVRLAARPPPPRPSPAAPAPVRSPVRFQPQPVRQQQPQQPQQPAAAPVRTNLFPSFELPDFFSVPFAAFRSLTPSSGGNRQPSGNPAAPQLFNSIGHPVIQSIIENCSE